MARFLQDWYSDLMRDVMCESNCSGHGDCFNGTCFCEVWNSFLHAMESTHCRRQWVQHITDFTHLESIMSKIIPYLFRLNFLAKNVVESTLRISWASRPCILWLPLFLWFNYWWPWPCQRTLVSNMDHLTKPIVWKLPLNLPHQRFLSSSILIFRLSFDTGGGLNFNRHFHCV